MKILKKKWVVAFLTILLMIIYITWDNNRLTIEYQEIKIKHMPSEFDGFKILQVTDLHEKEFGEDQKRLIEMINNIEYDSIVFTGDMLNDVDSKNYTPFYTLIEGIENKENAFFVAGNTDPGNYVITRKGSIVTHDFINGMEDRGVELLEGIFSIKNNKSAIHFVDFELSVTKKGKQIDYNGRIRPDYALNPDYLDHQGERIDELSILDNMTDDDVLIALNHYPVVDNRINYLAHHPNHVFRDYDLIIAGHYHGGQIRLPLIGALFIPESWYDRGGVLPPKDRVKGLWEYKGTKQYVSTGLGSSDAFPVMKFRLFNPPEINLLTLKSGHSR